MRVKDLKRIARKELKQRYWRCVIAGAIYISATFGSVSWAYITQGSDVGVILARGFSHESLKVIMKIIIGAFSVNRLIAWFLGIFLWSPLEIGARRFFIDNTLTGKAKLFDISFSLREHYLKKVVTMFLRQIMTTLGTLLFIVPGVMISYNFRLVPLLLSEYPDMKVLDILRKSTIMMRGNRMRLFKIEMSFIWWNLLSMFTFSIPQILYSAPMLNICYVHFYNELLEKKHSKKRNRKHRKKDQQ